MVWSNSGLLLFKVWSLFRFWELEDRLYVYRLSGFEFRSKGTICLLWISFHKLNLSPEYQNITVINAMSVSLWLKQCMGVISHICEMKCWMILSFNRNLYDLCLWWTVKCLRFVFSGTCFQQRCYFWNDFYTLVMFLLFTTILFWIKVNMYVCVLYFKVMYWNNIRINNYKHNFYLRLNIFRDLRLTFCTLAFVTFNF